VIEASHTSGARKQARIALQHGKKVFLLESLLEKQAWAQTYLKRGAIPITDAAEILPHLRSPTASKELSDNRHQLALEVT
jgi:DNA processing protein